MMLEQAEENWNIIDKYSASINKFRDLEEFRNEKKVSNKLN